MSERHDSIRRSAMPVRRLLRRLAAWARRRRAIRDLHRFDDRTLADMGVTRGEIEFVVRNGSQTRGRKRDLGLAAGTGRNRLLVDLPIANAVGD